MGYCSHPSSVWTVGSLVDSTFTHSLLSKESLETREGFLGATSLHDLCTECYPSKDSAMSFAWPDKNLLFSTVAGIGGCKEHRMSSSEAGNLYRK